MYYERGAQYNIPEDINIIYIYIYIYIYIMRGEHNTIH